MRFIQKGAPPPTITGTAQATTTNLTTPVTARGAFDQLDKAAVRDALAAEQASLCAFCMRHVDPKSLDANGQPRMRIAHRTPLSVVPNRALTWQNLLGSCDGNLEKHGRFATCDAAQREHPLTVDPTSRASVARLRYENGKDAAGLLLTCDEAAYREDIEILGLNKGDLPARRQKKRDAFREIYRRHHPKGPYGKAALREFFPKWLREYGITAQDMVGVVEDLLR